MTSPQGLARGYWGRVGTTERWLPPGAPLVCVCGGGLLGWAVKSSFPWGLKAQFLLLTQAVLGARKRPHRTCGCFIFKREGEVGCQLACLGSLQVSLVVLEGVVLGAQGFRGLTQGCLWLIWDGGGPVCCGWDVVDPWGRHPNLNRLLLLFSPLSQSCGFLGGR